MPRLAEIARKRKELIVQLLLETHFKNYFADFQPSVSYRDLLSDLRTVVETGRLPFSTCFDSWADLSVKLAQRMSSESERTSGRETVRRVLKVLCLG
jgi:hypothetical protein